MYGGTSNDSKKATWKMRHVYEQYFGDIYEACLKTITFHIFFLSTDDSVQRVKGLYPKMSFQTLGFTNVNGCFSIGKYFIGPAKLRK